MGLDMYLTKKVYIGSNHEFNRVHITLKVTQRGSPVKINTDKIKYIAEEAGYWRKANQIHKWFVDNVQDGKDDCQESYVSFEQLQSLKELCLKVLETKDATLLPPCHGFFFGSTEIDDYYFSDIEDTIKIIDSLDEDGDYYYQASW